MTVAKYFVTRDGIVQDGRQITNFLIWPSKAQYKPPVGWTRHIRAEIFGVTVEAEIPEQEFYDFDWIRAHLGPGAQWQVKDRMLLGWILDDLTENPDVPVYATKAFNTETGFYDRGRVLADFQAEVIDQNGNTYDIAVTPRNGSRRVIQLTAAEAATFGHSATRDWVKDKIGVATVHNKVQLWMSLLDNWERKR